LTIGITSGIRFLLLLFLHKNFFLEKKNPNLSRHETTSIWSKEKWSSLKLGISFFRFHAYGATVVGEEVNPQLSLIDGKCLLRTTIIQILEVETQTKRKRKARVPFPFFLLRFLLVSVAVVWWWEVPRRFNFAPTCPNDIQSFNFSSPLLSPQKCLLCQIYTNYSKELFSRRRPS